MLTRILMAILLLSILGCAARDATGPSVILIAVEGLDFDSVPCLTEGSELNQGLAEMCRESVRFTHTYTPSVMTQAALASVLTGRYPKEHGVRNNGKDFLNESITTAPEMAHANGYKTAFFSGGAPIFYKSGLAQGFELFDDNIGLGLNKYYRNVGDTFDVFLKWLERDVGRKSFFATIFLPDLQFVSVSTKSDAGVERELSRESQLKEIDESLGHLINKLKAKNLWDNSYVFLLGVNGVNRRSSAYHILGTNLHSDANQVTLLIKPARKVRDAGIQWSIDANVSLVDVGMTIYDVVGSKDATFWDKLLTTESLKDSLQRPVVDWDKNRLLISESSWAEWRGVGSVLISARKSQWLMQYYSKPSTFNTLTDSHEIQPLTYKNFSIKEINKELMGILNTLGYSASEPVPSEETQRVLLLGKYQKGSSGDKDILLSLRHLTNIRPWDEQLVGLLARVSVERGEWKELKAMAEKRFRPDWLYFSQRMLGEDKATAPACFDLVVRGVDPKTDNGRCKNKLALLLAYWFHAQGQPDERAREENFMIEYKYAKIDENISILNYQADLNWDTRLDIPGEPWLADMMLALPEMKKYKSLLVRQLDRWKK